MPDPTDAIGVTHTRHKITTMSGRAHPDGPYSPPTWSCSCGDAGSERGYMDHLDQALAAVQVAHPPVTFVHPCGHSQVSPIPHLCPQCGTAEPWS